MTLRNYTLQVICINPANSMKLIKGAIYEALSIHTWTPHLFSGRKRRDIYIKYVGNYDTKNFTLLNGSSLDNEPDFSLEKKNLDPKKDYTGQFVRCRYSGTSKTLKEGEIYYIEKEKKEISRIMLGNSLSHKLKIRGVKNYISAYKFEEIDIKEQRYIKLKNLKGDKIKTGEQTRKFLLYSEKERIKILFEILTKVITDLSKIIEINSDIDIITLMIKKGKEYDISDEDIRSFLKNKIETIIKPFKKR